MLPLSPRLLSIVSVLAAAPAVAAPDFGRDAVPVLTKYCVSCHGPEKQEAGIEYHELKTEEDAFRKHGLLRQIAEQVKHDEMPPFDADQFPSDEEREKLIKACEHLLGRIDRGEVPRNPGRVTIRRLNRNEYNYTVRDLFGVNFRPSRNFPADGAGGEGFDNTADALFLPPVLMEKYLEAANEIVTRLYGDEALRKRVIMVHPSEKRKPEEAAASVLRYHAGLAYRRRLSEEEDLKPLMDLFRKGRERGDDYETALRLPLTAILVNPKFLFRSHHDETGKEKWPLNDFELAARLSYFLWSSMPDRKLFSLADEGKLRDPAVLEAQVKRMLADQRSIALSRHFAGQWIGFDALIDTVEPDPKRYPEFDRELRASMYRESEAFFDHLFRSNRSVLEIIDTDFAFLNARLARHYGIPGVRGSEVRKVEIENPNRGGVIGMGSVLTVTSLPLRTSPVKRGMWILESLLGDRPPPPPPDAGELPADDKSSEGLSLRRQLEIHRDKPKCAGCHSRIDPLGFGLENFDPIGRWRTTDVNGAPIDSKAVLPGDISFSTPAELKTLLGGAEEKVARNFARKMLAYALGRSLEYYDEPVLNDIHRSLETNGHRSHQLILEIVKSEPFQMRSARR